MASKINTRVITWELSEVNDDIRNLKIQKSELDVALYNAEGVEQYRYYASEIDKIVKRLIAKEGYRDELLRKL